MEKTIIIILIIFGLTILQKYYYMVLYKTKSFNKFSHFFIGFIIRFGVIIHEICHMFFGILSGNKIKSITLFSENGGNVVFQTKDYIGGLSNNGHSFNYLFFLLLNQIGLFITGMGPLLIGILTNYLIFEYIDFEDSSKYFENIIILIIYSIFVPSFILSFQDLKIFLFSKQNGFFSSLFGSLINFSIFFIFVSSISYLIYDHFVYFGIIFLLMFVLQIMIFLIFCIVNFLIKRSSKSKVS